MNKSNSALQSVLIVYNPDKANALDVARQSESILRQAGIQIRIHPYEPRETDEQDRLLESAKECDAIVVLGGDGTFWVWLPTGSFQTDF
jgi:diacylglycerol kinase family enzyme